VAIVPGAFAGEGTGSESAVTTVSHAGDTFDALLVRLNGGMFWQIFTPDCHHGLGASSAPTTLTFNGLASALFGSFGTVTNATNTFGVVDDESVDNTGIRAGGTYRLKSSERNPDQLHPNASSNIFPALLHSFRCSMGVRPPCHFTSSA
jgi:hypothetical protein